jgi:hypothetical protein
LALAISVRMKKILLLTFTHLLMLAAGFGAGIYVLPILTAPPAPLVAELAALAGQVRYKAKFVRDAKGSDAFHWGEGSVGVGPRAVIFEGRLAPGPDYKLYLSAEPVETRADALRLKDRMLRVGDVKTFENFIVPLPAGADPERYTTVLVWCETFSQFISAARYR